MPAQNQPNYFDLAILSNDVYKKPEDRGEKVDDWSTIRKTSGDDSISGLKIQSYQSNNYHNHVVIAIAGTDSLTASNDWQANQSFASGGLPNSI